MKNTVPFKRYIKPDEAWNIEDAKFSSRWGHRNHKNQKRYWLNVFNRKLRKFFKKKIREG